jgi:predicted transcriptional regulator
MDIKEEKLELIEWLSGISDIKIIKRLRLVQESSYALEPLSESQKSAIDLGLNSIDEGKVHSHQSVMNEVKSKYPAFFK